ncbi:PTS sugar transporter subunit IIA [Escherichia coli]
MQFLCAATSALTGALNIRLSWKKDVWQREEIVTTGVGFGVAIPHTKSQWIRHSSQHCPAGETD